MRNKQTTRNGDAISHFATVKIKCKPLVKAYLENNFGSPVKIPENHVLQKLASSQLLKKNPRFNKFEEYKETIQLCISKENFRFDGFEINNMNSMNFNNAVDNYIKVLCRSNIDALLISQEKQLEWKKKFHELLHHCGGDQAEIDRKMKQVRKDLEDHEINIKDAIDIVVTRFLKLAPDDYSYDTVKKDYYRYRTRKSLRNMSPDIN